MLGTANTQRRFYRVAARLMCYVGLVGLVGGNFVVDIAVAAADPSGPIQTTEGRDGPNLLATQKRRILSKNIPDIKILSGSPPMTITLESLAGKKDAPTNEGPVMSVLLNKKSSVTQAEIKNGRELILTPGKVGKTEIIIEEAQEDGVPVHAKFQVTVWEPDYWQLGLTVFGGLGLFLLGMQNLSDGLQAVAGNRLRALIAAVTNNLLMATGVGMLVTMILQSSSITTVMVVGFVNSGFMTLAQAIGVIFGANIGTTITGWILVLKIGVYGLPIAGLGAVGYLFIRRDRVRYMFMATLGLGLVFLGLELMKDGFSLIKDLPSFELWFDRFRADSYFGVLKCAAVGCLLTFIVQSSSATLGITIGLAQIGVIPFETGAALVLGENIGTTITAWLASLNSTTNARRAAYAHILFNVFGVAWVTALFPWYMMLIRYIVMGSTTADISSHVTEAIAATHTGFNVTNTLVCLPLAGVLASLLQWLLPEPAAKEVGRLTNLDVRILESPVLALQQSRNELLRMAESCHSMMGWLREVLESDTSNPALIKRTQDEEKRVDALQDELVEFISQLLASNVPENLIGEARQQLRMVDEYESISDYIGRILKYQANLFESGDKYDDVEKRSLLQLHSLVASYLDYIESAYRAVPGEPGVPEIARGNEIAQEVRQSASRDPRPHERKRRCPQSQHCLQSPAERISSYSRPRGEYSRGHGWRKIVPKSRRLANRFLLESTMNPIHALTRDKDWPPTRKLGCLSCYGYLLLLLCLLIAIYPTRLLAQSTSPALVARLPAGLQPPFQWKGSEPILGPPSDGRDKYYSLKDPSIVYYQEHYHLFCTVRGRDRSHQIEYIRLTDLDEPQVDQRRFMSMHTGFYCAPQVFYFRPQQKWYLICQASDEKWTPHYGPAFSTTSNIEDVDSWSPLTPLGHRKSTANAELDFWIICDAEKAHLFFTSLDGRMWREETSLADFPHGWSDPVIVLQADVFEASHTYRVGETGLYLTVIEAQHSRGGRYYKAYVADRLDGEWKAVADDESQSFADRTNVHFAGPDWTDSISHGELLRHGFDEQLEISSTSLRSSSRASHAKNRSANHTASCPGGLVY